MTIRDKQQYVIISAELSTLTKGENLGRTSNLECMLDDLNLKFHSAMGVYKGTSENSFFVNIKDNAELETLKDFAFKNFNQESVLYSDSFGSVWLEYYNGHIEIIGTMKKVNPKYIEQLNSYTVVNGQVLTTEKV